MTSLYEAEKDIWMCELAKSKKKEDKKLLAEFKNHNQDYAEKLLFLYLARCKLVHKFAFIHYRALCPSGPMYDLETQFEILKDKTITSLEMLSTTACALKPVCSLPNFISKKSVMTGITGLFFKFQMEMTKKVKRFEHAFVVDPFDKKSMFKVKQRISNLSFHDVETCYDKIEINSEEMIKCVFLPDKELIRTMIKANIKFAKKDTKEKFLFRFGLAEHYDKNAFSYNFTI